jgi:hypothetical protein
MKPMRKSAKNSNVINKKKLSKSKRIKKDDKNK